MIINSIVLSIRSRICFGFLWPLGIYSWILTQSNGMFFIHYFQSLLLTNLNNMRFSFRCLHQGIYHRKNSSIRVHWKLNQNVTCSWASLHGIYTVVISLWWMKIKQANVVQYDTLIPSVDVFSGSRVQRFYFAKRTTKYILGETKASSG